jgi:glyoxylase-like metal-dependent hydrolase (beta-lactamase superfamily II)
LRRCSAPRTRGRASPPSSRSARPTSRGSRLLEEIAPGLRRWTARHPDWTPDEGGPDGWDPEVASLAWAADDSLVLIDPLVPDGLVEDLDALVAGHAKPVAVAITVFWHSRSADLMRERYGARVYAFAPALERIESTVTDPFEIGGELPGGIVAHDAERADEVLYWIPPVRALVAGDVLLGRPGGISMCPPSWIGGQEGHALARASLARLLDLPIEMLLVSHGEPALRGGRAALEKAIAKGGWN